MVGETYGGFPVPESGRGGHVAAWVLEVDANGELMVTREDEDPLSIAHRVPSDADYTSGYAVALRSDGTGVVVGRYAPDVSDLFANEDIHERVAGQRRATCGSSASRRPSPTRLKAMTVVRIARPGKVLIHQARSR